jgi:hypothetical protein
MKEETVHHWLDTVFQPHVDEEGADLFLLLIDRYRGYIGQSDSQTEMGVILDYIPAAPSLVQPLDFAVMKSLKSHASNAWKNFLNQIEKFQVSAHDLPK